MTVWRGRSYITQMDFGIVTVLLALIVRAFGYECDRSATVCETTLVIKHGQTMLHPTEAQVYPANGKLYRFDDVNQTREIPVDDVMTADGWEDNRLVIVANESLPGPPIIVYVGQRVRVHVINRLSSDTVTVHWHGLPLQGSPWMDGTPFVTQCPILPGQTFTYDFVAEPKGTHWYHSHSGNQRSKGMNGAFIIKDRTSTVTEHIMTVQDWNHNWDADADVQKVTRGFPVVNRIPVFPTASVDGGLFAPFYVTSVLINGRGRFYNENGQHNGAPLPVFSVDPGLTYRFRVIHVGILYPIRISIDEHMLTLVASDGHDIKPAVAESFIITAGERFDFEINTDQAVGNYWIRAETLQVVPHKSEAVLRYSDADASQYPVTARKTCSQDDRCLVVNCPFETYPADTYTDCLRFGDIQSATTDNPAPEPSSQDTFKEHFVNVGFPNLQPSINGIIFKLPQVSALTQPFEIDSTCDNEDCGEDRLCECTHTLSTNHNDVVQIVLSNLGLGTGLPHPMHLHGYSFYLLKMGYGTYNMTTSQFISPNMDIDCRGTGDMSTSFCNNPTWRNPAWHGNNVPGLNLINPPKKDTLNIPAGAYAVIRIKANNPGVWMLHCHIQLHLALGMRMLINSSYGMHPDPPTSFPVCHNFPSSFREDYADQQETSTSTPPAERIEKHIIKEDDLYGTSSFWAMFGVLVFIIIVVITSNIYTWKKMNLYKKKCESYRGTMAREMDNPAFSKL